LPTIFQLRRGNIAYSQNGLQSQKSLNKAYDAIQNLEVRQPATRLLDLLKEGRSFQASKPHDHVFSVLGMVPMPKDRTRLIPVTYNKSYDEICGDVTRFIIRETRNIDILQLCPLQSNRTYAFDWPAVQWSSRVVGELLPDIITRQDDHNSFQVNGKVVPESLSRQIDSEIIEWFDIENPIKEVSALMLSGNTNIPSTSDQPVAGRRRPLVLYGKVWGTLSSLSETAKFERLASALNSMEENYDYKDVPAYAAEDSMDQDKQWETHSGENVEEPREFIIFKRGLVRRRFFGRHKLVFENNAHWKCRGFGRQGDVFVSLEPGPRNVLLRRCPVPDELFEIVG
jgi:hypothetical protein